MIDNVRAVRSRNETSGLREWTGRLQRVRASSRLQISGSSEIRIVPGRECKMHDCMGSPMAESCIGVDYDTKHVWKHDACRGVYGEVHVCDG